jgi:hypothetical protein
MKLFVAYNFRLRHPDESRDDESRDDRGFSILLKIEPSLFDSKALAKLKA